MSVLSKDKQKKYFVEFFFKSRTGYSVSEERKLGIVSCILYRLKTGCQWRELPLKHFFSEEDLCTWENVYYHFNKWSRSGLIEAFWVKILEERKRLLDLSILNLDGSLTRCKGVREQVGYQKRRADSCTNLMFLSDSKGTLIGVSDCISGEHHDAFLIEEQFTKALSYLQKAKIPIDGLFMNADAGFDVKAFREFCLKLGIIPNINFNPSHGTVSDREEYFDELLYENRIIIERAFAWLDAYKALLLRFETSAKNWIALHLIAFSIRLLNLN
jgi:transposase